VILTKLKLTDVEIKNFLSYKDAKFSSFKNYNVLIGKNSSGKSNLFKILDLLINTYKTEKFSENFLFDENEELNSEITLTFKLSNEFYAEIFEILYRYLERTIRYTTSRHMEGNIITYNKWKDRRVALKWFLEKGYFNSVNFVITYNKSLKKLMLNMVSINHGGLDKPQNFYQTTFQGNKYEHKLLDLNSLNTDRRTIDQVFSISANKNISSNIPTLRNCLNLQENHELQSHNKVLQLIFDEFVENFLNAIYIIPDIRSFNPNSDMSKLKDTILMPDGGNLVKFICMKKITNQDEWINEWNNQLKYFIPEVDNLGQDIDRNNKTFLKLQEVGLNMALEMENMGAGILNIAHFLAYTMELKENKILCIEEPEIHLHPGLERKLRKKILEISDKIQIFITTHSREFLDENEEKCSIYLVKKSGNETQVNKITNLKENFKEIYENLDIDIEKYKQKEVRLYDEDFWVSFVKKAKEDNRIENKLWDFKQTFEMWKAPDKNIKQKKKIVFCEDIASFGNNLGGVLIVGISDRSPRKIVGHGLDESKLESEVKNMQNLIRKHINYKRKFVDFIQFRLEDKDNVEKECLIIAIAQTEKILGVRNGKNFTYPIRIETGKEFLDRSEIKLRKKEIFHLNYNFLNDLQQFLLS